jgi:REP element-mobilizing transposase RayT
MIKSFRRPNRLKNYDYSQNGAYFVTNHANLLSDILMVDNILQHTLTELGKYVDETIRTLNNVEINKYVIMPNHVHMIILLAGENNQRVFLQNVVKYIKYRVRRAIGASVWQKSFHDHIIRDEADYTRIWEYIENNPFRWTEDCYYKEIKLDAANIT